MERIRAAFSKSSPLLSVFFTAGHPRADDTVQICAALEEAGADMIEIGIPFADPISDGPTIQNSSVAAIKNGMNLEKLFSDLRTLRERVSIPVLLMGYLNPVVQYGIERFAKDAGSTGIDGVILPDMPLVDFEKAYRAVFKERDLKTVFLITSRTSDERIRKLDEATDAFLYVVASEAVTGAKAGLSPETEGFLARIKTLKLRNPYLVGFGIHDHETFSAATLFAPGAIVGSAFVREIAQLPVDPANPAQSESTTLKLAVKNFIQAVRG